MVLAHPQIKKEDALQFMQRQIQANMVLRGVVEPAYYFLGSDFSRKKRWLYIKLYVANGRMGHT